jgi:hypothetical protein
MLALALIPARMMFQNQLQVCIFKSITGIRCPLCGMTRACYDILHGHPVDAWHYNPLSLMLPLLLISEIGYDLFPRYWLLKYRRALLIAFAAGLALLFAVRVFQFFGAR